jgi:macrophage erythroblast attacher
MNFKPDLKLEYDYIRVVYEVILSDLRINKKIIEKDLNTIVARVSLLKKKLASSPQDALNSLNNLITKATDLQTKFTNITNKEEVLYNSFQERISQIEMLDESHYNFDNLKIYCEKKINNLLLDFFLREKFLETARNYIEEEKINSCVEYSIFIEVQNIIHSLKHKELTDALKWTNVNKNKLSKINSNLKFKLLSQQFIEKYKKGELNECVAFARENFKDHIANINDIKTLMILLAMKPEQALKISKYNKLLTDDNWNELENDFKQVFFQIYSMKSSSLLEILFQSGLMSLKSQFCYMEKKCLSCPICSEDIGNLAKTLPSSHHPVSALICRITGEIMDSSNPPLALPNGQVYSEKAINEQVKANGKFVCPVTNQAFEFDKCKKVFIC